MTSTALGITGIVVGLLFGKDTAFRRVLATLVVLGAIIGGSWMAYKLSSGTRIVRADTESGTAFSNPYPVEVEVTFTADGQVNTGGRADYAKPIGYDNEFPPSLHLQEAPLASLILEMGNPREEGIIAIGREAKIKLKPFQKCHLVVNDVYNAFPGNQGEFVVNYQISL